MRCVRALCELGIVRSSIAYMWFFKTAQATRQDWLFSLTKPSQEVPYLSLKDRTQFKVTFCSRRIKMENTLCINKNNERINQSYRQPSSLNR